MLRFHELATFPDLPGVYIFLAAQGTVLYIGKALSLKKRIASYFATPHHTKLDGLIRDAQTINYVVTRTEHDALLLEASLIRWYQPPYNQLLKDGNPFLYLLITDEPLPTLCITRTQEQPGRYFGPFINKKSVRRCYDYLIKTLQLFRCTTKQKHGCLRYHLKMCAGTCCNNFDERAYRMRMELAAALLSGNKTSAITFLNTEIANAHQQYQFELARQLHAYHNDLTHLIETIRTLSSPLVYRDATIQTMTRTMASPEQLYQDYHQAQEELAILVGDTRALHTLPTTIDCFDISHHQSKAIVGAAIRFELGIPSPQHFRKFIIRSLTQQDDYAALREIVSRRYRTTSSMPDIIMIDGGKGQRNAIAEIITDRPVISLAKKEERLFTPEHPHGIVLTRDSACGRLLIQLRDYAHHFALSYHIEVSHKQFFKTETKRSQS